MIRFLFQGISVLHAAPNSSTEDVNNFMEPLKYTKKTKQNETVDMILLEEEITPVKSAEQTKGSLPVVQQHEIVDRLKLAADWCKIHSNESCAHQNNTFGGISAQQSTFNFAQDTGYQTYSMNSTSMIENANVTPSKQIVKWNERITSHDDELHISDWKRNMINIYSSTPSKNRDRDRDN